MSWGETKWGSDRTIQEVLNAVTAGQGFGATDEVRQTLISAETIATGGSSYLTVVIANFTAPYTGTMRIRATMRAQNTSKYAWLAVSTTAAATKGTTLRDGGTVLGDATVSVTAYTNVAMDVEVTEGTVYYLHLYCNSDSSSYKAYCNSATVCYGTVWLPASVIKSVQRGIVSSKTGSSADSNLNLNYHKVTIGRVATDKAIVQYSAYGTSTVDVPVYSLAVLNSPSELYLYSPYTSASTNTAFGGVWQVIEFY